MQFDLDHRSATLSVGEFADFAIGPRESAGGFSGLWRARLGSQWHQQLREQTGAVEKDASFEVVIQGSLFSHGWTLRLNGRIDQLIRREESCVLREIKTVMRPLPCEERELKSEYPSYFVQLACYAAMVRMDPSVARLSSAQGIVPELLFVEADSGLSQPVRLGLPDDALFQAQLSRVISFLQNRLEARKVLRTLRYEAPFASFREGQETALDRLQQALSQSQSAILFEAPTGFGKTGILLEAALSQMKAGHFERLVYLTSKATGQIQVMATLQKMCVPAASIGEQEGRSLGIWLVRPKSEHCINSVFQCLREVCPHIRDVATRWEKSGLSLFGTQPRTPRDIASLRSAGSSAGICPYEITRASLPFSDVWIGDINYIFAPSSRGLFMEQPAFVPGRTLLIVDEAHNLPARVADAHSHRIGKDDVFELINALHGIHAPQPLLQVIGQLEHFLSHLPQHGTLPLAEEDDARHLLEQAAGRIAATQVDYAQLGGRTSELLWSVPAMVESLKNEPDLLRHWWSPQAGLLAITCIDAGPAIGRALSEFGGVLLSSATFGPSEAYAESIGLAAASSRYFTEPATSPPQSKAVPASECNDSATTKTKPDKLGDLTKKATKKLFSNIVSGSDLLRVEESREASAVCTLSAAAPWRDHAYNIAVDLRVDTTFQHRDRHTATTAATIGLWHDLAGDRTPKCAVFFPSYAYADSIAEQLRALGNPVRVSLQPRKVDLAGQSAWIEDALANTDALFLVLGSSFAEGIDLLGGRVSRAVVVGPALPEVNPIQHSRMEALAKLGREASFRRVYQIPGMQKVNQALGRLVRSPGQTAKVLLHCRRFADPGYHSLLSAEYRNVSEIANDLELKNWMLQP